MALKKEPQKAGATSSLDNETKDALDKAALFEARARLAIAQAEISRAQYERKKYLIKLAALK